MSADIKLTPSETALIIRSARTALGLTGFSAKRGDKKPLQVFADLLGVSVNAVQRWEQGRQAPTRTVLLLLDRVLRERGM